MATAIKPTKTNIINPQTHQNTKTQNYRKSKSKTQSKQNNKCHNHNKKITTRNQHIKPKPSKPNTPAKLNATNQSTTHIQIQSKKI